MQATIRSYRQYPVVLFIQKFPNGLLKSGSDVNNTISAFPSLRVKRPQLPLPSDFAYMTFGGDFFGDANKKFGVWQSDQTIPDGILNSGPMLFYNDKGHALVISPYTNFMAASTHQRGEAPYKRLDWGIMGGIGELPAGFEHKTLAYCSDHGVGSALEGWGNLLRRVYRGQSNLRTSKGTQKLDIGSKSELRNDFLPIQEIYSNNIVRLEETSDIRSNKTTVMIKRLNKSSIPENRFSINNITKKKIDKISMSYKTATQSITNYIHNNNMFQDGIKKDLGNSRAHKHTPSKTRVQKKQISVNVKLFKAKSIFIDGPKSLRSVFINDTNSRLYVTSRRQTDTESTIGEDKNILNPDSHLKSQEPRDRYPNPRRSERYPKPRGHRPSLTAPHPDISISHLGYWTCRGSYYYYNPDPNLKTFDKTLLDVKKVAASAKIPLHYFQLDSWFYPKDDVVLAVTTWDATKQTFPEGIANFQKQLGLPLIAQNR